MTVPQSLIHETLTLILYSFYQFKKDQSYKIIYYEICYQCKECMAYIVTNVTTRISVCLSSWKVHICSENQFKDVPNLFLNRFWNFHSLNYILNLTKRWNCFSCQKGKLMVGLTVQTPLLIVKTLRVWQNVFKHVKN